MSLSIFNTKILLSETHLVPCLAFIKESIFKSTSLLSDPRRNVLHSDGNWLVFDDSDDAFSEFIFFYFYSPQVC